MININGCVCDKPSFEGSIEKRLIELEMKLIELKSLQKEIDDAESFCSDIIIKSWGKEHYEETGNDLYELIRQNQLKIKQIIESL